MLKVGITDRLSLFIVIIFYTTAILVGYNFMDTNKDTKSFYDKNNKRLIHLVLIQFKEDIILKDLQKIMDGAYSLQEIPGVEELNFSENISPEGLGKGFTHSLTMKFDSAKDRDSVYLPHPIHQKFVNLFVPFTESVLVYDFWE